MNTQNIVKSIETWIITLIVICCSLFKPQAAIAQTGTWKAYMAYYEPQQIVKAGTNMLFVRASNGLYSYNLTDHSITTYDKVKQLNDCYISQIAWNPKVQRLIIVYQNSNIDIMDVDGNVNNISSIYTKSMTQDKTINSILINDIYAYLATGFGVVKINMQRAEIAESYILNYNISDVDIDNGIIYAKYIGSRVFIFTGSLNSNLIDKHNWTVITDYPSTLFTKDLSDWNEYIETVKTLQPDGPKYNNFGFMRMKDNVLYTCCGHSGGSVERPATVQIKRGDEWEFLQDDMTGVEGAEDSKWKFVEMYAVDVDPFDNKHVFAGGRTGLFEYYNGKLVKYYNKDNSILNSATTSNRYVLTDGITFDKNGSLWILQSSVTDNSLIEITKDGEWVKHDQDVLMSDGKSLNNLTSLMFDSRGLMWFVNNHWNKSSFFSYDTSSNTMVNSVFQFVNQDGTSSKEIYNPRCVAEDREGNIWIATLTGPYMIEAEHVYGPIDYVTQVKVPRNDGTNYADYLLDGVDISAIAIDGGNRKWFGTHGSGIYLISDDNMEQVLNFTTENSPLLSNTIESIEINHKTGEVFIGTDQGLCSYMGDATESAIEMVKDNVYAYPNPVVSGYDGLITVVGLSFDSDVKVLSTSGQLVAQGRSNGGTFTWNGRDRQGRRVASGVYMVAAATSEGKKGVVCKIAVIK